MSRSSGRPTRPRPIGGDERAHRFSGRLGITGSPYARTTVQDFDWYRRWLGVAEACGFEMLTTGDSQSLWADPFVSMAVAAQHTVGPRLGITVSNPMTRRPAAVASSLVALQGLSGGRMVYGLSSGNSVLRTIGVRPARVAELDAFGRAVKGFVRR